MVWKRKSIHVKSGRRGVTVCVWFLGKGYNIVISSESAEDPSNRHLEKERVDYMTTSIFEPCSWRFRSIITGETREFGGTCMKDKSKDRRQNLRATSVFLISWRKGDLSIPLTCRHAYWLTGSSICLYDQSKIFMRKGRGRGIHLLSWLQ